MFAFIKYVFITVFLSIATGFYLLCLTPAGLQYDLTWVAQQLPGKLSLGQVQGTLLSGFTLQNISYETAEYHTHIKTLRIHWHPEMLLHKKIAIEYLLLEDTNVKLSTSHSSANFNLNDLRFLQYIGLNHIVIKNFSLEKSQLAIQLNGEITDTWDMQWEVHIPELHALFPDLNGFLQSTGDISGPRLMPSIHALLNGEHLHYADQTIGKLQGQVNIIAKPHADSTIQLSVQDITIYDHFFKQLALSINGNVAFDHQDLNTSLTINIAKNTDIAATVTLPNFSSFTNPQQPISGKVHS